MATGKLDVKELYLSLYTYLVICQCFGVMSKISHSSRAEAQLPPYFPYIKILLFYLSEFKLI